MTRNLGSILLIRSKILLYVVVFIMICLLDCARIFYIRISLVIIYYYSLFIAPHIRNDHKKVVMWGVQDLIFKT